MLKRLLTVLACVLILSGVGLAAAKKKRTMMSGPVPDKAYLEKLLAGWSTGGSASMAQYYAQGDLLFFDVSPLKYANWQEYQNGTADLLKNYKSFKLTLGDDAQIHQDGNVAWSAATIKEDAVTTAGKHEMATWRWTAIFQKQDGKWLIVHEHTSAPLP